jgi:hypothetical protein
MMVKAGRVTRPKPSPDDDPALPRDSAGQAIRAVRTG